MKRSSSRLTRDSLKAGTRAPPFRLPRVDEGELSLEAFRGQRPLLVFSDPDCGLCAELAPDLEQFHRDGNGVAVLMISRQDPESNRRKVAELGLTFPVVLQRHWEISMLYGMFATPIAYLIDEQGVLATDVMVGVEPIRDLLTRTAKQNQVRVAEANGVGYFPGGPQDPTYGGGTSGYGNLFFHLLPLLEQGNLYQSTAEPGNGPPPLPGTFYSAWGPIYPGIATSPLKIYQNPSDPSMSASGTVVGSQTTVDGWGACGYAFNAQVFCRVDVHGNFVDWWGNAEIPKTFRDGTSHTILFTEKFAVCGQPGGLYGGANAWADAPNEGTTPVFSVSRFPSPGDPPDAIPSTGPMTHFQVRPLPYASDRCQYWLPQTARSSGILVGLADGSVRNVAAGVQPATWWAACTPAGGEILGSDW